MASNIKNEPAITIGAITGLVNAGLVLLFTFETGFSTEQQAAIMTFALAAVALLGAFVTRSKVTPVSKLGKPEPDPTDGQPGDTLQFGT